jgi:hypothetical protein
VSRIARLNRRAFLKLGAAAGAAALLRPAALGDAFPRIASALPLPVQHAYFADPDRLLAPSLARFDLLLAPAYIAAELIGRGAVQAAGWATPWAAGRAHDPDGAFTFPYRYQIAVLRNLSSGAPAGVLSWSDLLRAEGRVLWTGGGRLPIGAALLSRGYSPNDTHAGRLAQAGSDLARLASATSAPARLAIEMVDAAAAGQYRLPVEGVPLIEYDWVIPAGADPALARSYVQSLGRPADPPALTSVRLIPLMPLPEPARRQHAEIWGARGWASQVA